MWSAVRKSKKIRNPLLASTFGAPTCCTTASSAAVKLCWDVVWITVEKRFAPRSWNNCAHQTVKPACLREAERRFSGRVERWRRRSKTNCSDLCAFFLHCFQGQPGVMGVEGQPGLAGYTVSYRYWSFCLYICRGYECAKTNDVFSLYRANRSLHVSCRPPLVAEASEKVSGADIIATAANHNTCKIRMRLHQFDTI